MDKYILVLNKQVIYSSDIMANVAGYVNTIKSSLKETDQLALYELKQAATITTSVTY